MKPLFTTVLFLCVALTSFAQVKGNITDVKKEPVIGAAVQVKGSTTGTITDLDGNFVLDASGDATLVVSCLGTLRKRFRWVATPLSMSFSRKRHKSWMRW